MSDVLVDETTYERVTLVRDRADEVVFTEDPGCADKTAVTAAPTTSAHGVAKPTQNIPIGLRAHIAVEFTRASGDGTATIWVYGYVTVLDTWYRIATLTQMAETGADMNHAEQLEVGPAYARLGCRVAEISGTTATVVAVRIAWSK